MILRSIVTLEQEGADVFFGEPEFDVDDLLRTTPDGKGVVTLLEVADVMDRPRLYSTFVLWMLAQLYEQLPEVGDLPKPKLAFFFDEAHLLFKDASEALMDQIERTARLIRSKGVGVYFVTQAPTDVPSSVLSQLGNRIQHALRAFTPDDADALRKTARTFPMTDHYDVERTITTPGHRRGVRHGAHRPRACPTPLAATRLVPPDSRMSPLTPEEIAAVVAASPLAARYNAGGRPRERPRDHHGPPDEREGRRRDRRRRGAAARPGPHRRPRTVLGTMTPPSSSARSTGAPASWRRPARPPSASARPRRRQAAPPSASASARCARRCNTVGGWIGSRRRSRSSGASSTRSSAAASAADGLRILASGIDTEHLARPGRGLTGRHRVLSMMPWC